MPRLRHGVTLLLCTILLAVTSTLAITESLAGKIDWHKPLIGIPRIDLSPTFQTITDAQGKDKDVLVTVTERNIVAALDSSNGDIVWRQRLAEDDTIKAYQVDSDEIIIVSGVTLPVVRSFSAKTGHLLWETPIHLSVPSHLYEPASLGTKIRVINPPKGVGKGDILAIVNGNTLLKLNREDGKIAWSWHDQASTSSGAILQDVLVHETTVTPISIINSFSSKQLAYITLELEIGTPHAATPEVTPIPANIASTTDAILTGSNGVIFRDISRGELKALSFDGQGGKPVENSPFARTLKEGSFDKGVGYSSIKDIGLCSRGYFLALLEDDSADLIKWKPSSGSHGFETRWHFEKGDKRSRSESIWGGYLGNDEKESWVTRLFWSHDLQMMNAHTYNIDHERGYVFTGATFPYKDSEHGVITNAAFKLTSHPPAIDRFTAAYATSTGSIQLWHQESLVWSREESLAEVRDHTIVDLPERKLEETISVLDHEGLFERTFRHLKQLKSFPTYAINFIGRFGGGSYTKSLTSTLLSKPALFRDQFGFQKLIIVATSTGKLFALDSAHGNIVWSTLLSISSAAGSDLSAYRVWNVRSDLQYGNPVIAVIAERQRLGKTHIVGFHIDAFTGEVFKDETNAQAFLPSMAAKEIAEGRIHQVFPLPSQHCKTHIRAIAIAGQDRKLSLFPSCNKIKSDLRALESTITFSGLTASHHSDVSIAGYAVASVSNNSFESFPTWAYPLPPQARLNDVSITRFSPASFGRVLGDRTTLYKYLNPHLTAYTTLSATGEGSVHVLDSTTGDSVYTTTLTGLAPESFIHVDLSDNWLVFSYQLGDSAGGSAKGQRLVSVELFESTLPDVKSTAQALAEPITRTYILPVGVQRLAITTSKHGIAYKDLIIVTDRDQLINVPNRLLDPRRPDIPSKRDKEEFLVTYQPMILLDPHWTLTHKYDIIGLTEVIASPSLLESTSLIVSYGLDMFGSRVTPSGTFDILSDSFNKPQLLLTIGGLVVGIFAAQPAVTRKILKNRWF